MNAHIIMLYLLLEPLEAEADILVMIQIYRFPNYWIIWSFFKTFFSQLQVLCITPPADYPSDCKGLHPPTTGVFLSDSMELIEWVQCQALVDFNVKRIRTWETS